MVNLFGVDLGGAFDAIKGATSDLFQNLDLSGPQQAATGGRDPFAGLQLGGGDPFKGLSYGNSAFDNLQLGGDPFAGLGSLLGGNNPQTGYSALASYGYNPVFTAFDAANQKVAAKAQADEDARQQAQIAAIGGTVGNNGATYTGLPDNIGKWAAQTQQTFGDLGGFMPAAMLAIMMNESEGNPAAYNKAGNAYGLFQELNFGDGDPNWAANTSGQFQSARQLAQQKLASIQQSYAAHGLNPDERTRALDFAAAWAGHFDYDTGRFNPASMDYGVNQSGQQWADIFLRNYDNVVKGRQQASAPAGRYQGVGGLPSLTGGIGAIGQEFGDTDFSAGNPIYDYGRGSGVSGHTGIDWAVPAGTQVYMPAGLTGTVITSGGTAYFRDEDENPSAVSPQGQGELKIHLSNGMDLILGHMRNISVPVGTQLTAGQAVGLAGSANGGHIHVELRVADPSLPNGYRIIDPRTILGQPTGGGGAGYR